MNNLEDLRKKIDKIDSELMPLFTERMKCSADVAEYKRANNMPVLDKKRETEILNAKMQAAEEGFGAAVYDFYTAIMAISRAAQNERLAKKNAKIDISGFERSFKSDPTVVFQGAAGANSESALINIFGEDCKRKNAMTFAEVLDMVENGEADYGILPMENTFTGSITDVYDLLSERDLYIIAETDIPIEHCLIGMPDAELSDIKTVYSHEQAYLQSREFFSKMQDIDFKPHFNTALSAKVIAGCGDKSKAAIASRRAAKIYGLKVLAENISQSGSNATRFAAVAKKGVITEESSKISIHFTLPNESGSLDRILAVFARNGLNMVKIESRPSRDKNFDYWFFIDFEGCLLDDNTKRALEQVAEQAEGFRLLGNYKTVHGIKQS